MDGAAIEKLRAMVESTIETYDAVPPGWRVFVRADGSRTILPPPMPIIVRYLPEVGHRGAHAATGAEGTAKLSSHR